jgi:hypothetical protein
MRIGGGKVQRRAFLVVGGRTVVAALAAATGGPNMLFARDQTSSSVALEQRLADVLAAYDAQGNHRTGTPTDRASAEWLAKEVQQLGAEPELEPFALSRVDPQSCHYQIRSVPVARCSSKTTFQFSKRTATSTHFPWIVSRDSRSG